jgi:hypothetical protein
LYGNLNAGKLGVVEAMQANQMAAVIHDSDDHGPFLLQCLRFRRRDDFSRGRQR